ncbi:MAG: tetratricopeptide repeat protein [Gammaproteobacteria bacterium]|nr:tetratricopeptide repeat protein [Gammaproteobacteria bacterium]MBU1716520.1 tetratricopeptide repeat protein [Pseudomonadota bacterium]
MNRDQAIQKLKELFKEEYNTISGIENSILFFERCINLFQPHEELDAFHKYFTGTIHWLRNNHSYAERDFKKAIEQDNALAYPWHGLGNVYLSLKAYDQAINAFKKAIELDDTFAYPWNGLGNVYSDINEYDQAKKAYARALELDDTEAHPLRNVGMLYSKMKEYKKAAKFYQKAIEKYKKEKDHYWRFVTEGDLEDVVEEISTQEILKRDATTHGEDHRVLEILNKTRDSGIAEKIKNSREASLEFLDIPGDNAPQDEYYFEVLRRWNSYTPIVADNFHISKGGGYFLKIGKQGIVIDPGFNFIDNFRGEGHKFHEVDTIIISHAHNDHTSDLESILTLLHKYNAEAKESVLDAIAQGQGKAPVSIPESEINEAFAISPKRKLIDLYITLSVFKKYSGLFELTSNIDYRIHLIEKNNTYKIEKNTKANIRLDVIDAKHSDIISDRDSVGFVISAGDSCVIYTGDTGWNTDIEKAYDNVTKKHKEHYKLLVAHIGGFKDHEINYVQPDHAKKEKALYENHLGRIGLTKINETVKPDICFISEFGEEFKGHRQALTKMFNLVFEENPIFFPADIGLKFNFKTRQIRAINNIEIENDVTNKTYVNPREVETCCLRKDYSLHFFKRGCVSKSDLVQVLSEQFEKSGSFQKYGF